MSHSATHTLRSFAGACAVAVSLGVLVAASPAQADTTYCGHQIQNINPGQDGIAAFRNSRPRAKTPRSTPLPKRSTKAHRSAGR